MSVVSEFLSMYQTEPDPEPRSESTEYRVEFRKERKHFVLILLYGSPISEDVQEGSQPLGGGTALNAGFQLVLYTVTVTVTVLQGG